MRVCLDTNVLVQLFGTRRKFAPILDALTDGRVELVAEGSIEELKVFRLGIRDCGLGPLIDAEEELWTEARGGFRGFEIVP